MSDNPYQPYPDDDVMAPFAGRQMALSRMDHYLKDPATAHALTYMGRRWLGKTALLARFDTVFAEPYIGAYFPLGNVEPQTGEDLLKAVVEGVKYYIVRRDFTASRMPSPQPEPGELQAWFAETWLPEVFQVIRPHRKLVLLFDDAHHLLAMDDVAGSIQLFHQLLDQFDQLKVVMTIADDAEDKLALFSPLVNPAEVIRLSHLSADECRWLLQTPAKGRYTLPEENMDIVYRATGGHPQLLQRFAYYIYNYRETHYNQHIITPEIIKSLHTAVYTHSYTELSHLWKKSTDNEQLILMAISDLHYDDPLAHISAAHIADWLVESGYTLDVTAVSAALRSLDYRELIVHRGDNIELTSGLMQMWLLENARRATEQRTTPAEERRRRPMLLVAGVLAIILIVMLVLTLSSMPQPPGSSDSINPTVTLIGE